MSIKYRYVAIEGVIGAGKTTLVKKLAQKLNATLLLESFEENAFLPSFYENPERYAFPVEMSFLADRYNQLKNTVVNKDLFRPLIIADYFIDKSLIFSNTNLKNDEFNLYKKLFFIMKNSLPQPDLIIYLHQSIENLQKNIAKRGREYEKNISDTYLQAIHQGYMKHLKTVKNTPIIVVDTKDLDFLARKNDFTKMIDLLENEYANGMIFIRP
jgi:deoxyadenosine/deoxycytidine kinase